MAAENPMESLKEEATCPVCLEYFKDPVIIDCGHNFCRACIRQCWEGSATAASCPQCRETVQQRHLRPSRQLANMVEIAKRLSLQAANAAGGDGVCGEHQETLKLFCEKDQTPMCVVCYLSQAYRAHTVVRIEEAAQEYKKKIRAHLKTLRKEREKLLGLKETGEGNSREYLKQIEKERQKIVSEFQQLRQFLEEQERLLLARLEKLEEVIVKLQKENITKLSEEISCLSKLISEPEGKYKKPANDFLQNRVKFFLSRCEKGKFQQSVKISPELEKRLRDFSQKTVALMETLRQFKGTEKESGGVGEDTQVPQELLKRVASSLNLQAEEMEEPSDSLFDVFSATALAWVAFLLHEGVAKISTALCFQLRVANHQALLGRYDFNLWWSMSKFTDCLQEHDTKEYKALVEEGTAAVKAALQATSDAADTAARTMASAVSMWKAS
ncbi:zinc finger protein RFP-like [Macrochelys suwanniensis]